VLQGADGLMHTTGERLEGVTQPMEAGQAGTGAPGGVSLPPSDARGGAPGGTVAGMMARRDAAALLVSLVVALAFCYLDVFRTLLTQWSSVDAYSHGFLVPFISLYLAGRRASLLSAAPVRPAYWAGSTFLLGGLACLLVGRAAGVASIAQVSLIATLAGLILLAFGRRALAILSLPVAYLLLMMPMWDVLTEPLHEPFQRLSATIGTGLLRLAGVPVHQEGTFLYLPSITLEVAKVCSGVNYLVAVIAVAVPLAYLSFHDTTRRVVLVAFSISVATLANSLRVALIGFLVHHDLAGDNIHGPGHVLQGFFVAVVGYAAILFGMTLLSRFPGRGRPAGPSGPVAPPHRFAILTRGHVTVLGAAALVLVAAGTLRPLSGRLLAAEPVVPEVLGAWTRSLTMGIPLPERPDNLPPRSAWQAYQHAEGTRVLLYVSEYGAGLRSDGVRRFWTDSLDREAVTVGLFESPAPRVSVRQVRTGIEGIELQAIFWYDLNGRTTPSRFLAKLYGAWHTVTGMGRPPVVVVVALAATRGTMTPLDRTLLHDFARQLHPLIDAALRTSAPRRSWRPTDPRPDARLAHAREATHG
jgi:exosortase